VLGRLAGRAGWTLLDQALSSLSSLVLSITVARAVGATTFGAFTVAFAVYSVAVLVSRAVVSQPLPIRYATAGPREFRVAAGSSVGAACSIGALIGVLVVVVGLVIEGTVGMTLVAAGIVIPGVLVQDAWRSAFFASGRPQWAAAIDGLWLVVQVASVVVLVTWGTTSAVPYLLGWGIAGAAGAALACVGGGTAPRVRQTAPWLRRHWGLTRYMLVESLIVQGAFQGSLLLVGALAALDDVAALRGAQVVLGPVSLLSMSIMAFAVPEVARRARLMGERRLQVAAVIGLGLSLLGATWGVIMLLLPDQVGAALLGDSWVEVQPVLLASVIGQTVNSLSTGATIVVYARGETRAALQINVVVAAALLGFGMLGLALGGVEGVAWGYTAAYALVLPLWLRRVWKLGPVVGSVHHPVEEGSRDRNP
jgi:O-antigen/teichoic acid export membrane protein